MATILDMVRDVLTPDVVRNAGNIIGETPTATQEALRCAVPSLLAGVLGQASTPTGAERLRSTITEGGYGTEMLDNLGRLLGGGGGAAESLLSAGGRLIPSLFGGKADSVTDTVAGASGVRPGSASTLLRLAAPIVMSVIGKQIMTRGLDATGLGNLLMGQRASILGAAPAGLVSRLGLGDLAGVPAAPIGSAAHERAARETVAREPIARAPIDREPIESVPTPWLSRWWPALVAGAVGLALLFLLVRDRQPQPRAGIDSPAASVRQSVSLALPGGQQLNVDRDGFLHKLGTYLSDPASGPPPKNFVFDDLNFESGSTRLTPQSQRTVTALTTVLGAYPSARVRLEGHTDTTGDPVANKQLSVDRAEALKQMLVTGGVAVDRIDVEGHGPERPVASNETDAGRAQNRRIELVVLQR
ncbi:MAG: DUF937 domain-containing protein [Candidatus Rokuibacteriota bacterium]